MKYIGLNIFWNRPDTTQRKLDALEIEYRQLGITKIYENGYWHKWHNILSSNSRIMTSLVHLGRYVMTLEEMTLEIK